MDSTASLLFSSRSILTMLHGIVFGGGALLALAGAVFFLWATRERAANGAIGEGEARAFGHVTIVAAALLWLAVLGGTYIVFPEYRAPAPEGVMNLAFYPRALIHSNPGTAWIHAFGMEIKEHVPWMTAMLATAVAFVHSRSRSALNDPSMRRTSVVLLGICFILVAAASALGIFANKIAPVE